MAVKFSEFAIGTINADLEIVGFNSATPANVQVSYTDIKTDILAGAIKGTVAIGQVPFGSAANTVAGSNNLFWDAANGRLGIGTNTPSVQLEVRGTAKFTSTNSGIQLGQAGSASTYFGIWGSNILIPTINNYSFITNITGTETQISGINNSYLGAGANAGINVATYAIRLFSDLAWSLDNSRDFGFDTVSGVRRPRNSYFGTTVIIGSSVNSGEPLQVTGTAKITGSTTIGNNLTGMILSATGGIVVYRNGFACTNGNDADINITPGASAGSAMEIFVGTSSTRPLCLNKNGNEVIIGQSTGTTNASSILTLVSTTKGFRTSVMTNAQRTAIASPAVGLIVYCTDAVDGLYIYKSSGWTLVI